jgi:hypothetical protein
MLLCARLSLGLTLTLAALAPAFADSVRDRILQQTRKQVMALRVSGDKSGLEPFAANEPPRYGTGFLARTSLDAQASRYIIITAAHVVRNDRAWAPAGNGLSRSVFPYAELAFGRHELGGYRGVQTNTQRDIAQVSIAEPTDRKPARISASRFDLGKRYFVVSWGDAYNLISTQEEPYIKEVKYLRRSTDNSGLIEIEALPDQEFKEFKRSESGSPIYDQDLGVVAMLVEELVDNSKGTATVGRALLLSEVTDWLEGAKRVPVREPPPLRLVAPTTAIQQGDFQRLVDNGCVFIGKFSARGLPDASPQLKELAPFGKSYLSSVIRRFDDKSPDRITDADAYAEVALQDSASITVDRNTEVNFRKGCPTPYPKPERTSPWQRNAFYGPIISVLKGDQTIKIRKVVRLSYLEDFFYWGVVQFSTNLEQR